MSTTTTTTSDVDAADAPATVFTVALDRYVDDYKRPEGTTEILGAFATKHAAVAAAVTAAFAENSWDRGDLESPVERESEQEKRRRLDKARLHREYAAAAKALVDGPPSEETLARHEDTLEAFLGESEFGVMSSGVRPVWTESRVTSHGAALEACARFWGEFAQEKKVTEEMHSRPLFEGANAE